MIGIGINSKNIVNITNTKYIIVFAKKGRSHESRS